MEGYWTPPNFDRLTYASHKNSLTFAGERLALMLKAGLPE